MAVSQSSEIPITNPFSPPSKLQADESSDGTLVPIYAWLFVSIASMVLAFPADPQSLQYGSAFALYCFLVGVLYSSGMGWVWKLLGFSMFGWFILIALYTVDPSINLSRYVVFCLVAIANGAMGFVAYKSIRVARKRIITCLSIAYFLGTLFGPAVSQVLAAVVVAVVSALVKRKSGLGN